MNDGVQMLRRVRHFVGIALMLVATTGMAHAIPTAPSFAENPEKRCFANAITPEVYETKSQRVLVHPGFERTRHIPAVSEQGRVRVMVKDAHFAYQTVSPTYTLKFEDILVEPAREVVVNTPAKYESWTETVEVEPAKTVWKRCRGLYGHGSTHSAINNTDSAMPQIADIWCKSIIPAKKRIVHHTRMVAPPRRETKTIPARYERVARQVVQRPAFARKTSQPAEFASVPYEKQLIAARAQVETIPATYADVDQRVLITASQVIQAEILCDQYASRETVRNLQTALVERGYKIRIDGIYGPETQGAMEQFQRDHAISRGYMTLESLRALQVTPIQCVPSDCPQARPQTTVRAAQAALSEAGFFAAQDGIHGPQTQAALERFQAENGLEIGYLSAETMHQLNIIRRI